MDKDRFPTLSDPEDDDSLDSILKRSNPKPFNFRSIIQETTFFNQNEESEEDEDESKDTKKKKKFTQLLKTVFPKTIEEPTNTVQGEVIEKIQDHDEIFSDINTAEAYSEAAGANTLADIPEVQSEPLAEIKPVVQGIENLHQNLETPATEIQPLIEEDTPKKTTRISTEPAVSTYDRTPPVSAPPVFYETYSPKLAVKEGSVVEKHKPVGAIMAFLGAEFLSRRRDKKLERSIKKQSKELNSKIEQIKLKHQPSEPESLASILDRANYVREPEQKVAEVPTSTKLSEISLRDRNIPETNPIFYENKVESSKKLTKETRDVLEYETVPDKIIQNNEAIVNSPEINVQNNFESKKDLSKNKQSSDRSSINSDNVSNYSPRTSQDAKSEPTKDTYFTPQTQLASNTDYKQSIQTGAGVALIILAVFIVVFILR